MKRALEYIGYVVAVLTLISIVGSAVVGPPLWGSVFLVVTDCALGVLAIVLLWPTFRRWSLVLRRWLFRKFVVDLTADIEEFIKNLRTTPLPDYELTGRILKKEGYRHISARIETVQTILEGLISDQGTEKEGKLKSVGRKVGLNFVTTTWSRMEEHVLSHAGISGPRRPTVRQPLTKDKIEKRLALWAKMELTAGWGEFKPRITLASGCLVGEITIVDCFLVAGRNSSDPRLCAFLEGYIGEIISGLTGYEVQVKETICGRSSKVDQNCVFKVTTPQPELNATR